MQKSRRSLTAASRLVALTLFGFCGLGSGDPVHAHGDWGHVHVTGWAIENLPSGELRDFFAEPEVFSAALYGGSFPDSGYWVDQPPHREFAEYSHWEPFVQSFIEYIRANHPPPFDTLEDRQLVAFLMGCAAHGLQDEVFDSLFLLQARERDGHGQDEADGGTDFFLYDDGHIRFPVEHFVPTDVLLEIYADLPQTITADIIREGADAQTRSYVNPTLIATFATAFVEESRAVLPWASEHYLDPSVPGSLATEIAPTMRYMEAIWERLHDRWDERDLVVHAFPEDPRRLRSHRSDKVDSWITLVFGRAITEPTGELLDADGNRVNARFTGTRWGHPFPRLVRFLPESDLEPGAIYTARLLPGASIIGGGTTSEAIEFSFQVDCADPEDPVCPDLGEIDVPALDGTFVPPTRRAAQEDDGCAVAPERSMPGWQLLTPLAFLAWVRRRARRQAAAALRHRVASVLGNNER